MSKVMPSPCSNSRLGMKRLSGSCLIFFIFQIQVFSMASKAQLQLQRVKEVTKKMLEPEAVDTGNQSRVFGADGVTGQKQAGRGGGEEARGSSLCVTWIGVWDRDLGRMSR